MKQKRGWGLFSVIGTDAVNMPAEISKVTRAKKEKHLKLSG